MKAIEIFENFKRNNRKAIPILKRYYNHDQDAETTYKALKQIYLDGTDILEEAGLNDFFDTDMGLDWLWDSFPFDLEGELPYHSSGSFATAYLDIDFVKELIENEFNVELSYE